MFLGVGAIVSMPKDVFPSVNIPVVTIIWTYTGLTTPEMEKRVTTYSEYSLSNNINGIRNIESQTMYGVSVIKVYFQPDVNLDLAIAQCVASVNWIRAVMMAISSPQYVWTLFTGPLNAKLGTTLAEIQVTFSLLIVLQTFFSPFQAYLVDRFGPKLLISIGAIMSGGSWVLAAQASSLTALYVTYGVIGGFGTGIIYVGIIGLMVRWFPDRRGLATGLAAAGYGFGAFFTSFPIDSMDAGRAAFDQNLRESAGRGADVEADAVFRVDAEMVERRGKLHAAARHVRMRRRRC